MIIKLLTAIIVIGGLSAVTLPALAGEPDVSNQDVQLSPGLLALLRAEMTEIAGGVQGIAFFLATADWNSIEQTSARIRNSYLMEKQLTPAQAKELEQGLPQRFKQLDAQFHHRAEKLVAAAASHDPELVVFHYSRLIETCTACHSAYASSRFPGFAAPAEPTHAH